ncbi:hypothetical protein ACWDYH_26025 [Nocardia goodfellowii]
MNLYIARTGTIALLLIATPACIAPSAVAEPAAIGSVTGSAYPGSGPATAFRLCSLVRLIVPSTTCLPPGTGKAQDPVGRNRIHAKSLFGEAQLT